VLYLYSCAAQMCWRRRMRCRVERRVRSGSLPRLSFASAFAGMRGSAVARSGRDGELGYADVNCVAFTIPEA
jgi:hypothetical protein